MDTSNNALKVFGIVLVAVLAAALALLAAFTAIDSAPAMLNTLLEWCPFPGITLAGVGGLAWTIQSAHNREEWAERPEAATATRCGLQALLNVAVVTTVLVYVFMGEADVSRFSGLCFAILTLGNLAALAGNVWFAAERTINHRH